MAKVPTYGTDLVKDQALPGAQQTGAIEGAFQNQGQAQLAAGFNQAANVTAMIAGNEQRMLDADAMTRAEVSLKEAESAYRIEIGNRKGINGVNVVADSSKWYDDQLRKHAEGLQNDTQRRGFERLAMGRRTTFMDFAGRHQSQELNNTWAESKNANMQASINAVVSSGGDEPIIRQERGRIESNLSEISNRMGWTPEQLAAERGKTLTKLHTQMLQQLVESDPRRAKVYLDKYEQEIDGDRRAELQKFVHKGTIEAEGRDLSAATIGKGFNGGIALLKQEEEAAKAMAPSGDREAKLDAIDKARQFHNRHFAQIEQQKNYNQRQAGEQAYSMLREGKDVPLGVRNAMDPHAALTLEKQMAGAKFPTDWQTYNDLRRMSWESPEKFREQDLSRSFDKLAPKEREALLDLQQKVAKGSEEKDIATFAQQVSTAHNLLGFKASDNENKGLFDVAARDAVLQEEKATGKKLNYEGRQKVIDRLMVEGDVNGWIPGGGRRLYQVKGTSEETAFAVKVPSDDRKQIEAALRAKGKPASDAEIQRIYKKAKGL